MQIRINDTGPTCIRFRTRHPRAAGCIYKSFQTVIKRPGGLDHFRLQHRLIYKRLDVVRKLNFWDKIKKLFHTEHYRLKAFTSDCSSLSLQIYCPGVISNSWVPHQQVRNKTFMWLRSKEGAAALQHQTLLLGSILSNPAEQGSPSETLKQ